MKLLAAAFTGLGAVVAHAEDAPQIIFISENQSAQSAAQSIVEREYNAMQREALRETNFEAWQDYESVDWRLIPREFRDARLAEILGDLGLAPDDPADKGFTDFLEAQGFDVYRSWTERESDPITGAITETHEFWGDIGEPFSPTGDYRLSQEQIDRLAAADLVIMSPNTDAARYAWGGRANGQPSAILIEQWNGLEVPIIAMNAILIQTNEFGSWGWGWSYGFSAMLNTLAPYDRRDETPAELDRFVFPDYRPKVMRPDSPLLAGLEPADGDRLAIYKDYESFPVLPRTPRKFSNNLNYAFPANVRVVLEIDLPSFFAAGLDIPTRDPVLLDVAAGIRFFQPQDGVPASERVGTPAERRIYLAAGLADTGLYNLSATGEQLFMNLVTQFTQPTGVTTYTVTFDLGTRGTRTGGGELTQTVAQGEAAVAPEVEADEGWTFVGWDGAFDNITADTTVTALYEAVTYTVTFDLGTRGTRVGGGELTQTVAQGEAAEAPVVEAAAGWSFVGWDREFDAITSDTTVSAEYAQVIHVVTFDLGTRGTRVGGGELTQEVAHGDSAEAPLVEPEEGWEFIGWTRALSNITESVTINARYSAVDADTWAGLPIEEDGTVVTEAFGTIFPLEDYAFVYRLEAWVYLPEAFVTDNGAWVFGHDWEALPVDGDGWYEETPMGMIHMDAAAGFLYIHGAGHWAYPTGHVENGGRWVFLFGDP